MDRPNTIHANDIEDFDSYVADGIADLEMMLANESGVRTEELALAA